VRVLIVEGFKARSMNHSKRQKTVGRSHATGIKIGTMLHQADPLDQEASATDAVEIHSSL
jgi:hypothetical protein